MRILTDIGGTHVRFAVLGDNGAEQIKKYQVDSFHTFEEAFFVYCKELKIDNASHMAIATAGYPAREAGQTVWKFVNNNKWTINPAEFAKSNIDVDLVLNDFEAALWGLLDLPEDQKEMLREGRPGIGGNMGRCLTGAGTGLGFGYLHPTDQAPHWSVQRTHGGHIMAAPYSDEHTVVIKTVSRLRDDTAITVFENLASGPGLFNLYQAQCLIDGQKAKFHNAETLFENFDEPRAATALRLFHEFLGLFCHTAAVAGHSYDGLYLNGGVIDRLVDMGRFNFDHFERFLNLRGVASVSRDVQNMPVYYVKNRYLALRGLWRALSHKGLI